MNFWGIHRLATLGTLVVALTLTAAAMPAQAQALYEWREPGGAVVYAQVPPGPRDGVLLRTLKVSELPNIQRPAAMRLAAVAAPAGDTQAAAWQGADAKIAHALARLQAAERAMRAGQAPRAGERQHLADGHSRLSQTYFDRLAALDQAVVRAREALQAAYAERDALAIPH